MGSATLAVWLLTALHAAYYPLQNVRAGQQGVCKTVFSGTRIEPFTFEVIGVLEQANGPGSALIVVRLLEERLQRSGVAQGMSGSPCYLDGQLVGALGYALGSFAKEPIAGITPIAEMRAVGARQRQSLPWRRSRTAPAEGSDLQPIATPISTVGVPPAVATHFAQALAPYALTAGGRSQGAAQGNIALEPGAPVGAMLVDGDVSMVAMGTVTEVSADRVLAFGHPFYGLGDVALPMVGADVLLVLPSLQRSFKISNVGAPLGEFYQDGEAAIAGQLGVFSEPLTIALQRLPDNQRYTLKIVRDPELTPRLAAVALASVLSTASGSMGRGTLFLKASLRVPGFAEVTLHEVLSAERPASLAVSGALAVTEVLSQIWQNPFVPPPPLAVDITLRTSPQPQVDRILRISPQSPVVRAGEALAVAITLRSEPGEEHVLYHTVQIPAEIADEELTLVACDSSEWATLLASMRQPQPQDFAQLLAQLAATPRGDQLYVALLGRGQGPLLSQPLRALLPPSGGLLLGARPAGRMASQWLATVQGLPQQGTVVGQARTTLYVQPGR